jgi:hypothetical protein
MADVVRGGTAFMKKYRVQLAAASLAFCLAGCHGGDSDLGVADKASSDPAKVASAADVRAIYMDKTWVWQDGAGYFAESGNFTAWSGTGEKTTYASGLWWVDDKGQLCIDARWRTMNAAKANITCFDHRRDGNVWYQKKVPSGSWYVFKSDPGKPDDESEKLKRGDLIEAKVQTIEAKLGPNS